jgi:hypothetical protein
MTTMTEIDLQRKYTIEERDAMLEAYADACGAGDYEEADKIIVHMPINPRWAKIIAKVMGKEYLLENFNITYANEVLGEGWLNGR